MKLSESRLREIINEEISLFIEAKKRKKKKPLCTDRGMNKHHNAKTGKFTTAKDAGSWSVRQYNPSKKDCFKGVRKTRPSNTWTKSNCGRQGPYKCSTGKMAEEQDFTNCKEIGLDKDYKVDQKTGKRTVKIKRDLECAYKAPAPKIDPKEVQRLQKYKALRDFELGMSDDRGMVKVRKDVFDEYQAWLDSQWQGTRQNNEEKEPEETERERKDRLFPGYDDLKRISIGIVERKK